MAVFIFVLVLLSSLIVEATEALSFATIVFVEEGGIAALYGLLRLFLAQGDNLPDFLELIGASA